MKSAIATVVLTLAACLTKPPGPGIVPTVWYEARGSSTYFAVFVTGDGGWRRIDSRVSDVLRKAGMPVVGILADSYFARERTPEEMGADLARVLRESQAKWNRRKSVLVGYSRGADALPFMINRLPDDLRREIAFVALLGPGETTSFRVGAPDRYRLEPEVQRLWGDSLLCVMGTLEKHSACRSIPAGRGMVLTFEGGHHFGGGYNRIGKAILDALGRRD